MVAQIQITSKGLIKPSSPTPDHKKHHKLSFLDQFQSPVYVPLIFFYQNHQSFHQPTRSHLLKQSLSNVLTKFNHIAGRLSGNLSVHCNDLGALLVEAKVHSVLSQAIKNIPVPELNKFLPLGPYGAPDEAANPDDVPLLAVQITSFECGGTAVGVCISHKIADISSLVKFMSYWAAMCRGEKIDEDPLAQPDFDLPCQLFPGVPEYAPFPNYLNVEVQEKLVCKRFLFDMEKLAELKKLAATSDEFFGLQVQNPSRVEALSAFIWKQFIEISRTKGEQKSVFMASQTVNLRGKLKAADQNGNLFGNVFIYSPASLISWPLGNQFHELVWMFRTAIRRINEDFVNLVQNGVSYLNTFYKAGKGVLSDPNEVHVCKFTSWCRFPVYQVDYGWGEPLAVTTAAPMIKNGIILLSTKGDDGIEAWITMPEDEMAMLPNDFLSLETTDLLN